MNELHRHSFLPVHREAAAAAAHGVVCNYNGAAGAPSGPYRSDQLSCLNVIYSFELGLL